MALQATLSMLKLNSCIIQWVCAPQAGAHLKWLRQCELHRAETWCCAVPAEVLGTAVARISIFDTSVINLEVRSRLVSR